MGPLMLSETDLQFFLIFLLVYRFDPVRDMRKGGWSEKSEGEGKTKARRHWRPLIVDSRPCYQTVQTHQALRNTAPHSLSQNVTMILPSKGMFLVFGDICHS